MKTAHILKILNGKGGDYPDSYFDPYYLELGTNIEMEHTSRRDVAKIIAKAHLAELGNEYYILLLEMETEIKRRNELRRSFGDNADIGSNGDVMDDAIDTGNAIDTGGYPPRF